MNIACTVTDTGLELAIEGRSFFLNFPAQVWQSFPDKELLADNYAFLKSLHLPWMLDRWETIEFGNSYPLFKHQFQSVMLHNIPFCAEVDGVSTAEVLRRFMSLDFRFRDYETKYPEARPALEERAVLNMSFGKDSLLTYAVARETGLPTSLVMSVENDSPREYRQKEDIARRFSDEFGEEIAIVENNTGYIHRYEFWKTPPMEWGYCHLINEYVLNTLPFAFHHGAKFILLGNEKECDDFYIGREGYRCYPVFDQSSEWLLEMSKMATVLAGSKMHVMSLIEPLHDLAIARILHTRYPEIAKYQMSCFPDENDYGRDHFWCGHCTKCARVYSYLKAIGVDPQRVGLNTGMFDEEFADLYSVFGSKRTLGRTMGYDASPCGRDELLLAFYLALERGEAGALMDRFRSDCLEEARARVPELQDQFFSVQDSRSLPAGYAERVGAVYADALRA